MNEKTLKALEAVAAADVDAKAKGLGRQPRGAAKKFVGGRGDIPCPVCGGTVRYSVSAYNGHTAGVCGTDGCIRWIQ